MKTKTRTKKYAVVALGDQKLPLSVTDGCSESASRDRSASFLVSVDFSMLSSLQNELTDDIVDYSQARKADLCCGCCCDLVRACIIVDVCDICLSIMIIVVSVLGLELQQSFIDTIDFSVYDNDEMVVDDDEMFLQENNMDRLRMTGCGILFSLIGILGAYRFHKYLVLCTAIWYCVDLIRSVVTLQWANSVVTACFSYPHFALFMALQKGKITRENYYATEKQSCCGPVGLTVSPTVSAYPSAVPSDLPSVNPSLEQSSAPSGSPSSMPSESPSVAPSTSVPTSAQSNDPTSAPTSGYIIIPQRRSEETALGVVP
jgi:hypothetical protein